VSISNDRFSVNCGLGLHREVVSHRSHTVATLRSSETTHRTYMGVISSKNNSTPLMVHAKTTTPSRCQNTSTTELQPTQGLTTVSKHTQFTMSPQELVSGLRSKAPCLPIRSPLCTFSIKLNRLLCTFCAITQPISTHQTRS
jgi:hypothetical protein